MRFAHALPSSVTTISLLLSVLLLISCGQKGPLYLPQDDNPAATVDTASAKSKPGVKPESKADAAKQ